MQVEVPHELPQIHLLGEVVGGVDGGGVRRDVLLREPVHALLELLLGVVEEEGGAGRERAARGGSASGSRGAPEQGREPALHRVDRRAEERRRDVREAESRRAPPTPCSGKANGVVALDRFQIGRAHV